ncbi:MAG: hypothetical protein ACI965_001099 [Paraglaciecola sp.]|jgi:hypothetical protein
MTYQHHLKAEYQITVHACGVISLLQRIVAGEI